VGYTPHMETIQVVIDEKLLQAVDGAARRLKQNRSALIRDALKLHLRRLQVKRREEQDQRGYTRVPAHDGEAAVWEGAATWPEE